jgi:hypothetical protein
MNEIKFIDNKPYIEYFHKTGIQKGQVMKMFGILKNCKKCGKEFLAQKEYNKFCSWKCSKIGNKLTDRHKNNLSISKFGSKNSQWKGGRNIDGCGYVRVTHPGYPNDTKKRYILEHRLIMSNYLGRPLEKDEFIHHKNSIRTDNRIENLELIKGRSAHAKRHIYTTNKNWIYMKNGVICPHCNKNITVEQITKIV